MEIHKIGATSHFDIKDIDYLIKILYLIAKTLDALESFHLRLIFSLLNITFL